MRSPGAGKTILLERTIRDLASSLAIGVTEGDQASETDAARIRAAGCNALQINTGTGCHLDANMLRRGLSAEVVVITKSDLLPHVDFSMDRCLANVRAVNRPIRSVVLSGTTGEGVGAWYDRLNAERAAAVEASI
jgi:hydrogenase nickel incorporation protein HypB